LSLRQFCDIEHLLLLLFIRSMSESIILVDHTNSWWTAPQHNTTQHYMLANVLNDAEFRA
jgi:hypothetical protein